MIGEKLYKIIGNIDDDIIQEAEEELLPKKNQIKILVRSISAAACIFLILGIGVWYVGNHLGGKSGMGGNGHQDGSIFMNYAGPIFPMNILEDSSSITAERNTHFDFSKDEDEYYADRLTVTDSYVLTNNSTQEKNYTIAYPFVSSLEDSNTLTPTLKSSIELQKETLLFGDYAGGFTAAYGDTDQSESLNLRDMASWEDYKKLLEDGEYLDTAQKELNLLDKQVTVYTFYDVSYPKDFDAATLAISFTLPKDSVMLTYGMNGGEYDEERNFYRSSYFTNQREQNQRIIIIGEAPAEYSVKGYENGACEKEIETIKGKVKSETLLLSEVIKQCILDYKNSYDNPEGYSELLTEEHDYRALISMLNYTVLGEEPKERYSAMRLDDLISEAFSVKRVMYLTAEITIPAGKSVEISATFRKEASYDYGCIATEESRGVLGYDLLTKLGSNLNIINHLASIELPYNYTIVRQNFGFDMANDITQVPLDQQIQRYYLEIKKTE